MTSRRVVTRTEVRELFVFARREHQDDFEKIEPGSQYYNLVSSTQAVLDRGFLLLETESGGAGLNRTADGIVAGLQAEGHSRPCLFPDHTKTFNDINKATRHFLTKMKSGFPDIYLTNTKGEAETIRYAIKPEPFQSLNDFDPVLAGEMRIQYQYISNMAIALKTQNIDSYNIWMFRMAITIAHELTHFFTGYLTGDSRPITPPNVSVRGWPGGEAGRAWELAALGGVVEFWSRSKNRNDPGEPIIFRDYHQDTPGVPVLMTYVKNFASGDVVLPISPSSIGIPIGTRAQLRKAGRQEMNMFPGSRGTGKAPAKAILGTVASSAGASSSSAMRPRAPISSGRRVTEGSSSSRVTQGVSSSRVTQAPSSSRVTQGSSSSRVTQAPSGYRPPLGSSGSTRRY